jgi:hypothetical protein
MVALALVVPAPGQAVVPAVPPVVALTVAPVAVPVAVPGVAPPPAPPVVAPPPRAKLLKLDPMKDAKAFLDSLEQIQFYLRMPDFSMGHADESLTTDATNQEASRVWEGQLRLAVKDGPLRFLFDNKGSQYHGWGFNMLATLMQYCRPDTVTNAFSSLLSLFNNVLGDSDSIIKYWSRFDGLTIKLARCKVIIPSLLLVMLFLCALHGHYSSIMEQFCMRFKPIKTAMINSIISNVIYNDGFQVVDHSKKGKLGSVPPCVPAAAAAYTNSNRDG